MTSETQEYLNPWTVSIRPGYWSWVYVPITWCNRNTVLLYPAPTISQPELWWHRREKFRHVSKYAWPNDIPPVRTPRTLYINSRFANKLERTCLPTVLIFWLSSVAQFGSESFHHALTIRIRVLLLLIEFRTTVSSTHITNPQWMMWVCGIYHHEAQDQKN